MASVVGICSLALSRIGQGAISSLTEASTAAVFCNALYEQCLDAVLEDFPWNFATARQTLADLDDAPDHWDYRYAWPSDCLRALEIVQTIAGDDPAPFKIELYQGSSRTILTNMAAAVLIYVVKVTDPTLFSPLFVQALSWRLGAELADPITGDANRVQRCETMYQNIIRSAWASDSSQGQPDTAQDPAWIEARL